MKVTVFIFLLLITASAVNGAQKDGNSTTRLIVAFGNSLTAGYGVALDEAYPSLLENRLRKEKFLYRVVNAGISGDTTSGGLSRIDSVIRRKPDIVIVELGANDGLRGTPVEMIQSNLGQIIKQLQKKKIKVLLAGMRLPPNYGPEYTDGFHRMYLSLAAKYKIPVIPFFLEGTAATEGLNQADGLHPTAEGYQLVVNHLWPYLVPLLSK